VFYPEKQLLPVAETHLLNSAFPGEIEYVIQVARGNDAA
jgi:hypothetical protein